MSRIGIIGAGVSGLVLAYKLSRRGHVVTVLEKDSQPGGLATWHDYGGFHWDRFYHVILPGDAALLELLGELGLAGTLFWTKAQTGYYADGTMHSFNNVSDLLHFPLLNLADRIRLGAGILYGSRIQDWRRLEQVPVTTWLERVFGVRILERFWKPLLLSKFGPAYNDVSAVFIWSYLKRLYAARSGTAGQSAALRGRLGHVAGGYKSILGKLVEKIHEAGGRVFCRRSVSQLRVRNSGIEVIHDDPEAPAHFDRVIFTGPLSVLDSILSPELGLLRPGSVEYLAVICMVLVTQEPVTQFYTVNIADSELPFTGVIGMSSVALPQYTGGFHLTYFPRYVRSHDPVLTQDDEQTKQQFLEGARRMFPALESRWIVSVHIHRAGRVQPVQTLGFSSRVPSFESRQPTFNVLNTAQLSNDTLNNNKVVAHVSDFVERFF